MYREIVEMHYFYIWRFGGGDHQMRYGVLFRGESPKWCRIELQRNYCMAPEGGESYESSNQLLIQVSITSEQMKCYN